MKNKEKVLLSLSHIEKISKQVLPMEVELDKDAKEFISSVTSEFLSFVTSE